MQNIGVFFGSRSPEHDVSIITGEFIIAELKKLGYPVVPIYIGKTGEWHIGEKLGHLKFFSGQADVHGALRQGRYSQYILDLENSRGKIVFKSKNLFRKKQITVDIAFPALHGSYGEDGTIQGLFEMLGVPYVGCDVTSSAVTMDKVLTKLLYQSWGVPTAKFVYFTKDEWETKKNELLKQIRSTLKPTVFVKPACLGSSIAIAKVKNSSSQDLENRIEVALHFDTKVLIEEAVEPVMDLTCAVLGASSPVASLLQESVFKNDLFDFANKYLDDGGAQLGRAEKSIIIPARIDEALSNEIRAYAVKIYKLFGCSGTSRVDVLYNTAEKKYVFTEVNTLPGTLYHHLWKASGIEIAEVLERLLATAKERHAARENVTYYFDSTILQQANSIKLQTKLQP